ncbi:MAG TPA: hypothetical protein DIC53_08010 [Synergistaceae bacterium]|nr:hypothetical protein [Synergistaceae bacterium]
MVAAAFFRSNVQAALALQEDCLRYIELEGGLSGLAVRTKISVPTGGAIRKDTLADVAGLVPLFEQVAAQLGGRFKVPVTLGFPSRDILIRVIELPEMDLDDAREALKWDFEKHFPYAYGDAAVDIARVETPSPSPGTMALLVASCRLRAVETVMRVADAVGMGLKAIEPLNVALFRGITGPLPAFEKGHLVLFSREGVTQIILGYGENGILYRSSLLDFKREENGVVEYSAFVREVINTLTFIRKEYRGLDVETFLLAGALAQETALAELLTAGTGLTCIAANPWNAWGLPLPEDEESGWETVMGLAVRDIS